MKIVYLCSARLPSRWAHGVQILRMCDALAGLGHEVVLLHPAKRQTDDLSGGTDVRQFYGAKNNFTVEAIPVFQLPEFVWQFPSVVHRLLMNSLNLILEKRLANRALQMGAEIYFSRDMTPHAAVRIASTGAQCIFEMHQSASGIMATRSLRKLLTSFGNVYVCAVTGLLARDIEQEFLLPPGSIEVHHDGVDLSMFEKHKPRIRPDIPVVTYAGSLQPNRGVDVLIRAALSCQKAEFLIVGGSPSEVASLKLLAINLGATNITFMGQIRPQEVPALLQNSDLLVLPMRGNETHTVRHASPLKLFEYMASGTPIIATDLPSVREVVTHLETAFLIDPDDVEALQNGITSILDDAELSKDMSTNSLDTVGKYSWTKRAERMVERVQGIRC